MDRKERFDNFIKLLQDETTWFPEHFDLIADILRGKYKENTP